jgi:ribosomal protein S18 acetylase RimI-like enzyme
MFDIHLETIGIQGATFQVAAIPWDTKLFGYPVAEVKSFDLGLEAERARGFSGLSEWLKDHDIKLCSVRIPLDGVSNIHAFEAFGFRFVELGYYPTLRDLQNFEVQSDESLVISVASSADQAALEGIADGGFPFGRFHQDPRIDSRMGDKRYSQWVTNAFANSKQEVLKVTQNEAIVGFFVNEYPDAQSTFWSLTAISKEFRGASIGKRVWKAMMAREKANHRHTISTSISSHNIPVMNLYVSLGFRFPAPVVTLHWKA